MSRRGIVLLLSGIACAQSQPPAGTPSQPGDQDPPSALNADSLIQYPPQLFDAHVEGDVVLRLFVDSAGRVVPESSRVAQSSGVPGLDSAALTGVSRLRFKPARRRGVAVAASFLEPVEFRHPLAAARVGDIHAPTH
jgi:TonB family protein